MLTSKTPASSLSKLRVLTLTGVLLSASFIGAAPAFAASTTTQTLDSNGEYHPVQNEGACTGLSTVAQPASGIDGRATVTVDQTVAQAGLERLKFWRKDALYGRDIIDAKTGAVTGHNDPILWNDKGADGKDNWIPLKQYLANHNISEETYLNPGWADWAEIMSVQRALEASITGAHTRMTGSDEANKQGGIGVESLADYSGGSYPNGDITTGVDILAGERGRWVRGTTLGLWDQGTAGHYITLVDPSIHAYGLGQVHKTTILTADMAATQDKFLNWNGSCEFKFLFHKSTIGKYVTQPELQAKIIEAGKSITPDMIGKSIPPTWEDGSRASFNEQIPVQFYGKFVSDDPSIVSANGMTLTGHKAGKTTIHFISGNEEVGSYTIEVTDATLTSIDVPASYTTIPNTAPLLPTQVTAHYSDGTTRYLPIYWDENLSYKQSELFGKSYPITGHVPGWDAPVAATVNIMAGKVGGAQSQTVKVGQAPSLPKTMLIWDSGAQANYRWGNDWSGGPIKWDPVDPAEYNKPGNVFRVFGVVPTTSYGPTPVVMTVTVEGTAPTEPPASQTPATQTPAATPSASATPSATATPSASAKPSASAAPSASATPAAPLVTPVSVTANTLVEAGKEAKTPAILDSKGAALPAGTKFEVATKDGDKPATPSWAVPNADGTVAIKPEASVEAGDYSVRIKVTVPNQAPVVVEVPVTVFKTSVGTVATPDENPAVLVPSNPPVEDEKPAVLVPGNSPVEEEKPAVLIPGDSPVEDEKPAVLVPGNSPVEEEKPAVLIPGNSPVEEEKPAVLVPGDSPVEDEKPAVLVPGNSPIEEEKPAVLVPGNSPIEEEKPAVLVPGNSPVEEEKPAVLVPGNSPVEEEKPAVLVPGNSPIEDEKPAVLVPGNSPVEEEKPAVLVPGNSPIEDEKPAVLVPGNSPVEEEKPAVLVPGNSPTEDEKPAVMVPGNSPVEDEKPAVLVPGNSPVEDEKPVASVGTLATQPTKSNSPVVESGSGKATSSASAQPAAPVQSVPAAQSVPSAQSAPSGDKVTVAGQQPAALAYTGASGLGSMSIAGLLALLSGVVLVAARRRKNS